MKQIHLNPQGLSIRTKIILNRSFLGFFLFITILALIMKIIDGILLDIGWNFNGTNGINLGYWMHPESYLTTKGAPLSPSNPLYKSNLNMLSQHPSTLWFLTQFTWITTILIIFFLSFRFFKYDESLPRWLRWIMAQRTLSLVTMYEMIVSIVFWVGIYDSFDKSFNGDLRPLEVTITAMVHAIIPFFILCYSLVYLVKDEKASILREAFIYKGIIYPVAYIFYYLLISVVWTDPYEITNIHQNIIEGKVWYNQIWISVIAIFIIWTLLGLMILIHNLILLKYNIKYDPAKDYEIIKNKQHKIEKIQRKVARKLSNKTPKKD